ncbi:MAG: hypothetical protein GF417_08800 [Candidatus Latescibacteria bacterium]|nr:hypothetical protein [Candidatus Latescibacterota bacterium]
MSGPILAILLTHAGIAIIAFLLKKFKGMRLRISIVGMILIFLPFPLKIGFSLGEPSDNALWLIAVVVGFALFVIDMPKAN